MYILLISVDTSQKMTFPISQKEDLKKKIKIGKTVVQNKKESEHSWETKGPGGEAAEDIV